MFLDHILACPKCGSDLEISATRWICASCNITWVVDEDGIVRFLERDYFFGADRSGFNNLLNEIRKMSAKQFHLSIKRLEGKSKDFSYSYCLDPTRADWTVLGNFHKKIIVDLGCGYGSISIPLAKRAMGVICVDATLERLRFLSIVAKFNGVKNIILINSDAFNLPLKQESIDAFICIGLLEWVGYSKKDASPADLQQIFLKYLWKLLSKDGEIWIGIENRLNPFYFIGGTSHGDLPFTPLMPRFMADLIYRMLKGAPYITRTYTKHEYLKLLKGAGFKNVEFFHAFPHYQRPNFISSYSIKKIISKYLEKTDSESVKAKILAILDRLHLSEILAPAFFIKAKKS